MRLVHTGSLLLTFLGLMGLGLLLLTFEISIRPPCRHSFPPRSGTARCPLRSTCPCHCSAARPRW
jgi:hypothetical protein